MVLHKVCMEIITRNGANVQLKLVIALKNTILLNMVSSKLRIFVIRSFKKINMWNLIF